MNSVESIVLKMKEEQNAGLGRIFRYLRGLAILDAYGDFVIYKMIIRVLRCAGHEISDRSIVGHASNLDFYNDCDFSKSEKLEYLDDLQKSGAYGILNLKERSGRGKISSIRVVNGCEVHL